jgi:hypothetical protein
MSADPSLSAAPESRPEPPAVPAEYQALRIQVQGIVIALLVMAGSLNVYLWKQLSLVNRQAIELTDFITNYTEKNAPQMDKFVAGLRDFEKTHPDIQPLLSKYLTNAASTNQAPAASVEAK